MRAFSKINLFLKVLGKRSDGYHNLQTVMQTLQWHDTVTITVAGPATQGAGPVQVTCNHPGVPTDDKNLVTRAAKHLMALYPHLPTVVIDIDKRIPVAAGLAGGSSNCAATLVGMNQLFGLGLTQAQLLTMGLHFGADVPFCIMQGTALAEGVGEVLTPLPTHPPCWVVLACLPLAVSTAQVFAQYAPAPKAAPPVAPLIAALNAEDLPGLAAHFYNALAPVTTAMHPQIVPLIQSMRALGALNAAMSGSGPSVFGYFNKEETAHAARRALLQQYNNAVEVFVTAPHRPR